MNTMEFYQEKIKILEETVQVQSDRIEILKETISMQSTLILKQDELFVNLKNHIERNGLIKSNIEN